MSRARTPRDMRAAPEREKLGLARDILDDAVIGLPGECWITPQKTNNSGYTWIHRRVASLFMDLGGREIHHTCENKRCANPAHLLALTVSEHKQLHVKDKCLNGHDLSDPAVVRWAMGTRGKLQRWCRPCDADRRRRYRRERREAT